MIIITENVHLKEKIFTYANMITKLIKMIEKPL